MPPAESLKAAIYSRYSTDLQNERSTEDQIDLCKSFAKREGFCVVATYADKAVSGASIHGRYDLQRMISDAYAGKFDVIVVEALDRLSRDMEDMAGIYKRLSFHNIEIIEVHGGKASTAIVGMKAMFAQMFREENVHKVRRGMTGLIKQGRSAGGKAYGYRPRKKFDQHGELIRGELEIVPDEAAIVVRVFEDYAKGSSAKAICKRLNAEGVKSPRGKQWAPSALNGSAPRGNGMLRNPAYVGRIVWNKVRMVKDPNTGKRVSRPNPESEWTTANVPELRIVSDELFEAVQAQMAGRAHIAKGGSIRVNNRPKRLLSGLLKCRACGSGMAVAGVDKSGRTRLRCSAHTNSGGCSAPKTFYLDEVETLVIDSLTRELASPDQISVYADRYIKARIAEETRENGRRTQISARIAEIAKDNDCLLDLLMKGMGDRDVIDARMKAQGRSVTSCRQNLLVCRSGITSSFILRPSRSLPTNCLPGA
jgi:site-specific DNA recombinase